MYAVTSSIEAYALDQTRRGRVSGLSLQLLRPTLGDKSSGSTPHLMCRRWLSRHRCNVNVHPSPCIWSVCLSVCLSLFQSKNHLHWTVYFCVWLSLCSFTCAFLCMCLCVFVCGCVVCFGSLFFFLCVSSFLCRLVLCFCWSWVIVSLISGVALLCPDCPDCALHVPHPDCEVCDRSLKLPARTNVISFHQFLCFCAFLVLCFFIYLLVCLIV